MPDFITGEGQGPLHRLVRHPPVPAINIEIARTVLQKDADRLGFVFPDQDGITVAATQPHIRSNGAKDPRKLRRSFPGRSKGADSPAAAAADGPVVSAMG